MNTVRDAIFEVLYHKEKGEMFSLIWLRDAVQDILGRWVTDGTISRYLRWFNEGKWEQQGLFLRWEVIKGGVYRLVEIDNYLKIGSIE